MAKITCLAKGCKHNDNDCHCALTNVQVGCCARTPSTAEETQCSSFEAL